MSKNISFRQDKPYIGAENTKVGITVDKLFFEVVLFLIIATVSLVFFLRHIDLARRYFESGPLNSALGILVILILSPFGAHLIARIIVFLWEKLGPR